MPHFASAIFDGLEAQVSCERTQVGGIQRQCAQARHLPGPQRHDLGPIWKRKEKRWFMVIYGPRHQNLQETKRGIAKLIYNAKNYGFSILITIDNWVSKPTNITGGAHIVCATNLAFLFGCPEHLGENICEGTSRTKVRWPSTHGSKNPMYKSLGWTNPQPRAVGSSPPSVYQILIMLYIYIYIIKYIYIYHIVAIISVPQEMVVNFTIFHGPHPQPWNRLDRRLKALLECYFHGVPLQAYSYGPLYTSYKSVKSPHLWNYNPIEIAIYDWLVVLTILKNMKVSGKDYPIYYGKIKNVPNHQPDNHRNNWYFRPKNDSYSGPISQLARGIFHHDYTML